MIRKFARYTNQICAIASVRCPEQSSIEFFMGQCEKMILEKACLLEKNSENPTNFRSKI